jgi:hypothetical protein
MVSLEEVHACFSHKAELSVCTTAQQRLCVLPTVLSEFCLSSRVAKQCLVKCSDVFKKDSEQFTCSVSKPCRVPNTHTSASPVQRILRALLSLKVKGRRASK